MADENKPAFYPRVGRTIAKNFRSAQPPAFVEDPRAMDLPQYGDVDLSVPTQANLEMSRRMAERDAQLKRQQQADRSPLEKVAGTLQTGRLMGSALTQAINSLPTRIAKGDEAADQFMQERMYQPTQPTAYEYAGDIGDFLEKLETQYKIPPVLPEAVALQYLTGPATSQAMRTAGRGAEQAGRAIERRMEPVVKGALEQGGLPREMALGMGANTQSNVLKQRGGNYLGGERIMTPERYIERLMTPTIAGETPAQRIPRHEELLNDPTLNQDQLDRVRYQLGLTKGEAALDQWAKSNLLNYYKNDLATPNDPVRQFIDKSYVDIEAKFAKDQERVARMAERAALEPDPRRKANLTRQAQTMRNDAQSDYELAMDNVTHLPKEDLLDVDLNEPYMLAQRKQEGFPEQGMGVSDPARRYETLADGSLKISRAGDLQKTSDIDSQVQQATQELRVVEDKIGNAWIDFLRGKGLDEQTVITLNKMPTYEKAQALGMSDELQLAQNKQGQFFQINNSYEANAMRDNPFVSKLDPEAKLYTGSMYGLGFDHVMDVLRQDIAAGRIRPEQLNKLSVDQAVRRTAEYNLERAKTMRDAKLIQQEGFTTYKDYPDQGYKWVELAVPEPLLPENYKILPDVTNYKNPGNELYTIFDGNNNAVSTGATEAEAKKLFKRKEREQQLADALKYEGDTMGHCVGGYCPDVVSGKSKIYSLRDSKGEPHVTIEVVPQNEKSYYNNLDPRERIDLLNKAKEYRRQSIPDYDKSIDLVENSEIIKNYLQAQNIEIPPRIKQIKGKQNAKPIQDYIPFVQDFVRSGNWSEIGDFKNTDLISADTIRKAGWDLSGNTQKLFTKQEYDDLLLNELNRVEGNGMKRGGKVSISNNPDTMMLELGNKRMKEGGSEDDTKPFFGGAGTKKYAAAKKRAEQADVNTLRDPKTYAVMAGLMGERPDEMGFSVLHPDYQAIKDVAEPAFGLGIAAQAYPVIGPLTKGLPVGASVKNVTPMKASEALGKIEGRPLKITQADRTKVGGGYLGGPGFSGLQLTEPEYRAAEAAWAVQNAGTAKTILGGGGDNAVYAAMLGTPTQHQSNQMVFDKLLGDFKKAAKRGELTPELRDLINMRLASAVDKKGNPVFPADVDIMDKKFRDIADTFSRRSIAGHLMGGVQVGGKKGQIIDYDKIIRNTTDPDLLDQPTGALGNRLFTLSGGIIDRPDLHPAFPTILQGEDLGVMFTPVERDIVMKDFVEKTMREKGRKPGYMDYTRGNPPTQLITEDILTELQKLGKKKGGAVKQPAAYIDGNEFVEAAQKYGIKDSMSNLNMIVNLVNKGLSVDDAARQVSDSGMHKAAGGEVSGDDLILEERPL
jgi:hypothetical protein